MIITEITGTQLRQSRELLGLSQWKLTADSGINRTALKMYELHNPEPASFRSDVMRRLLRYLERQGVVFGVMVAAGRYGRAATGRARLESTEQLSRQPGV